MTFESDANQVQAAAQVFDELLAMVSRRVDQDRLDSAMAWTRATASFATCNPTGSLRSPRLEAMVRRISHRLMPPVESPARNGNTRSDRRQVLHVITETHVIGGHRSVLLRWLEFDTASEGSVVVTRPAGRDDELARATERSGGQMHRLDQRSVSGRSRALRALASSADFIVIHAHPDDAIAAVALCDPYGALPPQVMIDHADHVFWLLPGSPALHVSVRPAARDVAIGLRGVPRDNTAVLPIPVRADGSPRVGTARDRQRAILNIPSSDVLAVTVARSVKYRRSPVHPGFLDTVVPAVERVPNLHVVAIGPSPEEPDWQRALIRTQGRIRALGPLSDPGPYLAAADIYLDSFPFTSHTSMLEAVSHDLPVLAGTRYSGTARLLGAGTLLGGTAISAQSDDDYARTLARLASDPPLRAQVAQASREVLETQHLERAWRDRMEAVLAAADERGAAAVCGVVDRDLEYAEVLRGTESQAPLQWILAAGRRDFDRLDRGRIAWGSWRSRVRRRLARLGPPSGVEDAHHFVQGTRKADTDQLSTQEVAHA